MTSATKGTERAAFVNDFLEQVLPPVFRFGTGDVTDSDGRQSGQVDVVIEYPIMPTLPLVGTRPGGPRLYLAEGVAAVVEVKSNLEDQWKDALATAGKLAPLRRNFGQGAQVGSWLREPERVPFFAVGYTGWRKIKAVQEHLEGGPVDGILIIDSGLFAGKVPAPPSPPPPTGGFSGVPAFLPKSSPPSMVQIPHYSGGAFGLPTGTPLLPGPSGQFVLLGQGAWSLWGLIVSLHTAAMAVREAYPSPRHYG